jgi:hypothetical protein
MRCRPPRFHRYGSLAFSSRQRSERVGGSLLIVAVFLSLTLTGCGKKGPPEPPADVPNTFPRPYPSE